MHCASALCSLLYLFMCLYVQHINVSFCVAYVCVSEVLWGWAGVACEMWMSLSQGKHYCTGHLTHTAKMNVSTKKKRKHNNIYTYLLHKR